MFQDASAGSVAPVKRKDGRGKHLWQALRKSVAPQMKPRQLTALGAMGKVLFPHSVYDYPGDIAGLVEILQGKATRAAVRAWRSGRRRTPKWVFSLTLAALLKRRAELDHAIAIAIAKKEAAD